MFHYCSYTNNPKEAAQEELLKQPDPLQVSAKLLPLQSPTSRDSSTCHSCPHHTVSWQDQRTETLTLFAAPGKAIAGAQCKFNGGKDPSEARSCSRHMPAAKRKEAPPALSCRPLSYREDTKPRTTKTIQKGNRTKKGRKPLHFMPSPKQSHTQQHRQPSLK